MKLNITIGTFIITAVAVLFLSNRSFSQTCEWRLANQTYSSVDPDGAGPATGSATFTLQAHTVSGTVANVNAISTGFSYQSAFAMIPTTPGCAIVSNPANITVSPFYTTGGFSYTTVNQCSVLTPGGSEITTGGQTFNRRAVGTMDGTSVNITTAWQDMFTVTLWTLGSSFPQGGYIIINSGAGGTPGEFTTYAIADDLANEYVANSLTYTTPVALGGALPVLFSKFDAKCTNTGTLISWATTQEANSSRFEIERSTNGTTWANIGSVAASGNSTSNRAYQQLDLIGGTALYRIKQIDKDGQFIYTDVARTNCQVKNISSVIYPVPAKDMLNVVIKSDRPVRTQLMVYDMQGKLVKKVDVGITAGNNNFRINLIGLAPGDYMLRSNDAVIELNKIFTVAR